MRGLKIVGIGLCALLMAAGDRVVDAQSGPGSGYASFGTVHRSIYYNTSVGFWVIPYDWFINLETLASTGSPKVHFKDSLDQYHVIRTGPNVDPMDPPNELGLPLGFIRSPQPLYRSPKDIDAWERDFKAWAGASPMPPASRDPNKTPHPKPASDLLEGVYFLGHTCALCHTGQLAFNGKRFRIDGGSGTIDVLSYGEDLVMALEDTLLDKNKFKRFMESLKEKPTKDPNELMGAIVAQLEGMNAINPVSNKYGALLQAQGKTSRACAPGKCVDYYKNIAPIRWGPGRGDAFSRGGNTTLGALVENEQCGQYNGAFKIACEKFGNANRIAADAPVANPHIWYSWKYNRVEWNASIQNPLGRNAGQAITTSRRLFFFPWDKEVYGDEFRSDVDLKDLYTIEQVAGRMTPPLWPDEFQSPIDEKLATNGKRLYIEKCKVCHIPETMARNEFGQEYDMTKRSIIKVSDIGTDPGMASNFGSRRAVLGKEEQAFQQFMHKVGKDAPASEVMQFLTTAIMVRGVEKGLAPSFLNEGNGKLAKINPWSSDFAYLARSNAGIWATPPFLHNGSVPTLYQLLLPKQKRVDKLCIGSEEFDPREVGLKGYQPVNGVCPLPSQFLLDTSLKGNSNAGHEFKSVDGCENRSQGRAANGVLGCELTEGERWALVEYLKTCDLDLPDVLGTGDQKSMAQGWEDLPPRIPVKGGCERREQTVNQGPASSGATAP